MSFDEWGPSTAPAQNPFPVETLVIETARLALTPFSRDDLSELHRLFQDAGVRRYLLDDQLMPVEWVADEIAASEARFAADGTGLWAVRLKGERPIIGFVGFRPFHEPPQLELLYGLLPAHWAAGFATEAAQAMLRHAFDTLGFTEVHASADTGNTRSFGVMERIGMRPDRRVAEGGLDTTHYRITRADYERGVFGR